VKQISFLLDPFHRNPQHQTRKSRVRYEQVAAATQHKQRSLVLPRKAHRFDNRFLVRRLDEPSRWPSDAERRVLSQWNLFPQ